MALTRCKQCGKEHEELDTEIGFGKPAAYFEIPESEREKRIIVNSDLCDIDHKRFFARGVLQIPVHGHEHFGWGIWVELGAADFDRYVAFYESPDQANEPPLRGHIATSIPAYRKTSLGIPVGVQLTRPTTRPIFFVEAGVDHPLAEEQCNGVSVERLHEYLTSIEAKSSSPVHCASHGLQERAYVCQHFSKHEKVGFFEPYAADSEEHDPDEGLQAWCQECERVLKEEGEWTKRALEFARFRWCCSGCFQEIKNFNRG